MSERGPPHEIKDIRPFLAIREIMVRAISEKWDIYATSVALEYAALCDRSARRRKIPQDLDAQIIDLAKEMLSTQAANKPAIRDLARGDAPLDGRVDCPGCGSLGERDRYETAVRKRTVGTKTVVDVGWRCPICRHEFGFEVL